jgi:hypothetical protein
VTAILAFVAFWWQPVVGLAIISFMFWFAMRPESPELKLARQKADYDRAHAYTDGKCPESD